MWNFIKLVKRSQVTQEKTNKILTVTWDIRGKKPTKNENYPFIVRNLGVCTCVCTCVCTYIEYYICLFQIYKQVSALHVPTWISSVLFFTLLMEYLLFIIGVLLHKIVFTFAVQRISYLYTYISLLLEPPSPSYPTPLGQHSTELSSRCFTAASHRLSIFHRIVRLCRCYCPSLSNSPLPTKSTCPFSVSASLFLPCQ